MPLRVRVGVTGHRQLHDEEALARQVRHALDRLRSRFSPSGCTPVVFTAVSALAEGADRLVAREILAEPGGELAVPLPLELGEYEQDFSSEASRCEFRDLLDRTSWTETVSHSPRPTAYEDAGRYVVDHADALVAIWDGEPARGGGGTATIVDYAWGLERDVPVLVIDATGDHALRELAGRQPDSAHPDVAGEAEHFNAHPIRPGAVHRHAAAERARLLPPDDPLAAVLGPLADWFLPTFSRADLLAERYQRGYHGVGVAVFLAAAAAVALAAAQGIFWPELFALAWFEAGLIGAVVGLVWWAQRAHVSRRWLGYRSLAERIRNAMFVAVAGGEAATVAPHVLGASSTHEAWPFLAASEVWRGRPREVPEVQADSLRRFLVDRWVAAQRAYFERAEGQHEHRHHQLRLMIGAVVVTTLALAVVHAGGWVEETAVARWPSWLAIVIPTLGGAVAGIGEQREYLRHSQRYAVMLARLRDVETRMERAADRSTLRTAAMEADAVLRRESEDWYDLMRVREIELPA